MRKPTPRASIKTRPIQSAVVSDLVSADLLTSSPSGVLALTELGRLAGSGVVAARGVLTLSRALSAVPTNVFADPVAGPATVIAGAQLTPELDAVYMSVNGKGLGKEIATFYAELQRQGAWIVGNLRSAPDRTAAARAKKAVACLLWGNGVPRAQMEQLLTRHERDKNAAGTAQGVAARTVDVLPIVLEVVRLTHPDLDEGTIASLAVSLPVRLELGVPPTCVDLGRAFGQRLPRSAYLQLHQARITSPDDLVAADRDALIQILTPVLAGASAKTVDLLLAWAADQRDDAVGDFEDVMPGVAEGQIVNPDLPE